MSAAYGEQLRPEALKKEIIKKAILGCPRSATPVAAISAQYKGNRLSLGTVPVSIKEGHWLLEIGVGFTSATDMHNARAAVEYMFRSDFPLASAFENPKTTLPAIPKVQFKESNPCSQEQLMKYDPTNGQEKPYPSHAKQYREWHGLVAWIYNPWTGKQRLPGDIGTDVQGFLIANP
jgi:hypothetical protein